jgi:hypothetical protein
MRNRFLFPFLVALFLFSAPASGQELTTQAIVWSPKKLAWTDFREEGSFKHSADTHWMLLVKTGDDADQKADSLLVSVKALFIPALSWVNPKYVGSSYLLAHEQVHFDIAEWGAREMRRELETLKLERRNYRRQLEQLRRKTLSRIRSLQAAYDEESAHSRQEAKQAAWQERVAAALEELKGYAENEVWRPLCGCEKK